ncbi:hypothetical protein GCM10025857_39190 [Alicyclobacillus contaminans]|uniref:hypothetical protein n=1 Tax=Alicyclobacillus contaminans TaxID=392016 RepID=UPI000479799E|nr:hypothetical protein [Alicyclobacillus contaminans]GMA52562.1 hypothetical protein GCM10025857_39190 [Alicyclobacillus contaminans]
MTTKVRIDGVTIETTGEYEHALILLDYLISRHSGTAVMPPTKDELAMVKEALKEVASTAPATEVRDIDKLIEDFAHQHTETDRQIERTNGRPRRYPKVGVMGEIIEGPSMSAIIGEMLATSGDIPEHWMTGIKTDESGRKRYKTYYHCPVCGDKGRHYLYERTETCKCRACGAELSVTQAVQDVYLERDQYGNFFAAKALADLPDVGVERCGLGGRGGIGRALGREHDPEIRKTDAGGAGEGSGGGVFVVIS